MGYLKPKKNAKRLERRQKAYEDFISRHKSGIPPGSYTKPGSKKSIQ